jgi:pimeloyl-ACP methyl ester carboxylesterase
MISGEMMSIPTIKGITPKTITTDRITTRVLFSGPEDGIPILLLHGNISSATWWEETMITLPEGHSGIAPDQRGFGDSDPEKKINATRGYGDMVEDAILLLDHLDVETTHVAGFSWGCGVIWQILADYPQYVKTVTMIAPASPYGFGATRDNEGTPTNPDFAGSGAGLTNPEMVLRVKDGDRSTNSQFSPRTALRALVVKPPLICSREEELVSSMLGTHIGEEDWPGDFVQSTNWPHTAPGKWGPANVTSPKYAGDVDKIIQSDPKTDILWVRGSHDLAVSDTAASDPGYLGRLGLLPGWPGEEIYPPQPMLGQTRAVLEKYAAAGGRYEEVVIQDAAHIPFIEKPDEFNVAFHAHLMK